MNTPLPPPLPSQGLQLWQLSTPLPGHAHQQVRRWLSPHELQRAAAYAHPRYARQFEARRGLLRLVLGHAVGCHPRDVALVSNPQGKPLLCQDRHARCDIHFNLSHSHHVALLAVTRDGPVGIDVERIDPARDVMGIAKRYFHPEEYQQLISQPREKQAACFYDLWACKEAVVKAQGQGIASGISQFRIQGCQATPGTRACMQPHGASAAWSIQSFRLESEPHASFAAAVALPDDTQALRPLPPLMDTQALLSRSGRLV